ncbi:MAG: hypothetical protein OXF47_02520 [Nitrospira sp.]|nr:hypothetical protein [Nitrospira sp.]
MSWPTLTPSRAEWRRFVEVLLKELEGSQVLERLMFENRKSTRPHYTMLHQPLMVRS